MIDKQVAALERERRVMRPMFVYLTLFCAALMVIAGYSDDPGRRMWFGIQACFWFIFGAMILLRYHINRVRVETMTELKKIQIELSRLGDREDRDRG
jgi:peptidoglycan/LPS O-acetylase OafA/YrhL